MPPAEVILWQALRRQQLGGFKFRRQYSIGSYVVDFYCVEVKLAIEADGESHYQPGSQEYDERREEFIQQYGVTFLRFTNVDVYDNLEGVLTTIHETLLALSQAAIERSTSVT
jgi:very-short-patch-repair endonuclease